jgi:hypothetical protein
MCPAFSCENVKVNSIRNGHGFNCRRGMTTALPRRNLQH